MLSCEAAALNDVNPLNAVTLRKSSRARASRGRPQSLIDYNSYMDTKRRVAWILEQSCSMSPDIHDLVENIKSVLKSDEKHMAEAVTSATFLEQVVLLLVLIKCCPWFGSIGFHLPICVRVLEPNWLPSALQFHVGSV